MRQGEFDILPNKPLHAITKPLYGKKSMLHAQNITLLHMKEEKTLHGTARTLHIETVIR